MRRFCRSIATGFSLVALLATSPLQAQGINLFWDDCAQGGPAYNKSFACDSDAGSPLSMVLSVVLSDPISDVVGADGVIDIQLDGGTIPDFWRFDPGGCRQGKLVFDPSIGGTSVPYSCRDAWSPGGGPVGGLQFTPWFGCNNRARIRWVLGVPQPVTLDPTSPGGAEWYMTRFAMLPGGTTSCTGCQTPACLVATQIRIARTAGHPQGDLFITDPAVNQHITWQGGGTILCPSTGPPDCPVPVVRPTWGEIKSMYR